MDKKKPGKGKYYTTQPQKNRTLPKGVEPGEKTKANANNKNATVISPKDALYSFPAMLGFFGKEDAKTSPTKLAKEMEKSDAKRAALKAARTKRKK